MSIKNAFDKVGAAVGITMLSPVFLTVCAVNAVHFKENPFYFVTRQGKDGENFNMLKFRTMREGQDEQGQELPDEQRVSKWGEVLRATSIDEFPQLINILKGDMSFVGPRPLSPAELQTETSKKYAKDILSVKPGLTGPWQTAVIGTTEKSSHEDRLKLDASYALQNAGLWGDIKFMLKTIPAFFKGHDGEYLGDKGEKIVVVDEDEMDQIDKIDQQAPAFKPKSRSI